MREAVADLIRERHARTRSRSSSRPNWDRSYTECFGFTLEEIYTEGARSFEAKLRSAGPAAGVAARPVGVPAGDVAPPERAEYGLAMLRAGFIGPPNGAPPRDPAAMELLFTSVARAVDQRTAPAGPVRRAVGVRRRRAVARARRQRLDRRGRRPRAAQVDVELRCRFEDLVDIVAGRLDPRRAVATRRLRPHGSPRALWAARGLF